MALICVSLSVNNFEHFSCICHLYIFLGEVSSLNFQFPMLRTSEKNYFKHTEYNHFLILEFVVMDSNYKMDLELPRSFGGLLSRVELLLFQALLFCCWCA